MSIGQAIYGACSVSFVALIALMLLRGRISSKGILIVAASALSAAWAAGLAIPELFPHGTGEILDSLRVSAWLILLVALVGARGSGARGTAFWPLFLSVALAAAVVGCTVGMLIDDRLAAQTGGRLNDLLHVGLSVGGLLAAENVLRNVENERRRDVWPLCLALGGTFAFELFVYADRLMVPGASATLPEGRGLVGLFAVPLLALAIVRNREWRVDIHVSRAVVLHTAALIASGLFFLIVSAIAVVVRELGGVWGPVLQVLMLLGSTIVLVSILGARELRIYLKHFVSRHFFSHRFDYRAEWLRFVSTVSEPSSGKDNLSVRVVRALAQIIDSPAGTLWRIRDDANFTPQVGWNVPVDTEQKLPIDDSFISGFRGGEWIQVQPASTGKILGPLDFSGARLAIPLQHSQEVIAFVVLSLPSRYLLDRETFDLLRAAGKQAASYLAEEQSTRALLDSRLLTDFSKRFAFVIHDVKNLASQLGLTLVNARSHLNNPEFREDMLQTLESSVAKMNRLVGQLKGSGHDAAPQMIAPDAVIATLVHELASVGTPIETRLGARDRAVAIDGEDFRAALQHLINNAREASKSDGAQPEATVVVASHSTGDKVTIEVMDYGPGMDEEFIREELFRPFRSTKPGGLGIGAYQTRELLRRSGGDLDVISQKGIGTVMRVTLPTCDQNHLAPSAA
jgi:putative PEP-CTERM system histidine kinase